MGYTKRTLQELNLIDNFLSNAIADNEEVSEPFYRLLLSVLLGKKLKKIHIRAQRMIPGKTPELRGIRLDVEITEYDEGEVCGIYDIEPHIKDGQHLPRHNRYYQAKIDGRYVKCGLRDFTKIPDLYVITITNYDVFGQGYMVYTFRNRCEEIPELLYDDGLHFLYFNTQGTKGGSQAIKNMLSYFQNSTSEYAVDEATQVMDYYVRKVKNLSEVEADYMTMADWLECVKEEMAEEIKEENIQILVRTLRKFNGAKESAVEAIREAYPQYSKSAEELVEKYWTEETISTK